jgi:AhpC/TSA family
MRRPGVLVGVLALAAVAFISLNSLSTEGPGSRGIPAGEPLPPFAVPLAPSDLEGDANVSDRACAVRGPRVLNVCELAEQGPVVLAFFAEPSERCDDQIDVVDRVRARFPDVRFAAVAIRGDRDELRQRVRRRGWELPVGHDRDGAVANAYAVAICPTITFAARGGEVASTAYGSLDEDALAARVARLRGDQPVGDRR